nr:acylsucrose fructofuranosidase 1 [Solanum nigrum]
MELFRKNSFLLVLLLLVVLSLSNCDVFGSYKELLTCFVYSVDDNVTMNYRTGYHFQPPMNWMNDPNGPMYYNGIYHLFYQYNPNGSSSGRIIWAHSISMDLINWTPLEPAIYPSKKFDKYNTWSGSATILPGNKPVILYTGVVDVYMSQVQNYAVPANLSDPYLRVWVKPDNNPLIVPDTSINKIQFRDPSTAWMGEDGHWRIVIGSVSKQKGSTILYRSKNFINWIKAKHPLYSSTIDTGSFECPDFFPVALQSTNGLDTSSLHKGEDIKHVLKYSLPLTYSDQYTIGTYDTREDRYIPDVNLADGSKGLRLDYGMFYASKSFYDPSKNRRVVWGWSYEGDGLSFFENRKGWAGIQAIPRKIWLDGSGKQLVQWPVEELKSLRKQNVRLSNEKLDNGEKIEVKEITASQADVEVTFSFSSLDKAETFDPNWSDLSAQDVCVIKGSTVQGGLGPFGLATLASQNLEEYTSVFFRIFKAQEKYKVLMCSDATRSSYQHYNPKCNSSFAGYVDVDLVDKKLSLKSLIDNSIVESFGVGGKVCITSRVYPMLAIHDKAHLFAFNNGTETITIETLDAWSMDTAKIN